LAEVGSVPCSVATTFVITVGVGIPVETGCV
jgi:hypothetical protein